MTQPSGRERAQVTEASLFPCGLGGRFARLQPPGFSPRPPEPTAGPSALSGPRAAGPSAPRLGCGLGPAAFPRVCVCVGGVGRSPADAPSLPRPARGPLPAPAEVATGDHRHFLFLWNSGASAVALVLKRPEWVGKVRRTRAAGVGRPRRGAPGPASTRWSGAPREAAGRERLDLGADRSVVALSVSPAALGLFGGPARKRCPAGGAAAPAKRAERPRLRGNWLCA